MRAAMVWTLPPRCRRRRCLLPSRRCPGRRRRTRRPCAHRHCSRPAVVPASATRSSGGGAAVAALTLRAWSTSGIRSVALGLLSTVSSARAVGTLVSTPMRSAPLVTAAAGAAVAKPVALAATAPAAAPAARWKKPRRSVAGDSPDRRSGGGRSLVAQQGQLLPDRRQLRPQLLDDLVAHAMVHGPALCSPIAEGDGIEGMHCWPRP